MYSRNPDENRLLETKSFMSVYQGFIGSSRSYALICQSRFSGVHMLHSLFQPELQHFAPDLNETGMVGLGTDVQSFK